MRRLLGYVTLLFVLGAVVFVLSGRQVKAEGTSSSCTVEINVGTPVDVACVIPESVGKNYTIALWAKHGDENSSGGHGGTVWNWQPCDVGGLGRCQNVPAGWTPATLVPQPGGTEAVQVRMVPDNGAGALRGRLRVSY
jgi:hypothetical protein